MEQRVSRAVSALRATFESGRTATLAWRLTQLRALLALLEQQEEAFVRALQLDLGKSRFESVLFEISVCQQECRRFISNIATWMSPTAVSSPLALLPARSRIDHVPHGVCLIIAAFNYPLQLAILPLIAAIGAGNAVLLKPSELSPNTSALLAKHLPQALDSAAVSVVEGGVDATTALLTHKFDYIFFTGSERVGKIVLKAAAEHLTPVTLELGGKSPVYVDKSADLPLTARRIIWGKLVNAGQTCIAPDYVLVHRDVAAEFTRLAAAMIDEMVGTDPFKCPSFARIVNKSHAERLASYLKCGRVVHGGRVDVDKCMIGPTLLADVDLESPVMREEIFGAILPIIPVNDSEAAIKMIKSRPKPLALYVFAHDRVAEHVLARTSSGGAAVNDVMMHFSNFEMPFGGVGTSGLGGAYHGKHGFDTFSHARAVVLKSNFLDAPQRYMPYDEAKLKFLRRVFEHQLVDSGTLSKLGSAIAAIPAARLMQRLRAKM